MRETPSAAPGWTRHARSVPAMQELEDSEKWGSEADTRSAPQRSAAHALSSCHQEIGQDRPKTTVPPQDGEVNEDESGSGSRVTQHEASYRPNPLRAASYAASSPVPRDRGRSSTTCCAPTARARSWPQPASTSCPALFLTLVSTPLRCKMRTISRMRSVSGRW